MAAVNEEAESGGNYICLEILQFKLIYAPEAGFQRFWNLRALDMNKV